MFREVLLSYRLLFGQGEASRKAYSKGDLRKRHRQSILEDSLLDSLCAIDCRKEQLYAEVNAGPPKEQYSARKDFPFFGQRLVALQLFVVDQNPSDFWTLWHDRRDICEIPRNADHRCTAYICSAILYLLGGRYCRRSFDSIEQYTNFHRRPTDSHC